LGLLGGGAKADCYRIDPISATLDLEFNALVMLLQLVCYRPLIKILRYIGGRLAYWSLCWFSQQFWRLHHWIPLS
jgi:hypothetical protein